MFLRLLGDDVLETCAAVLRVVAAFMQMLVPVQKAKLAPSWLQVGSKLAQASITTDSIYCCWLDIVYIWLQVYSILAPSCSKLAPSWLHVIKGAASRIPPRWQDLKRMMDKRALCTGVSWRLWLRSWLQVGRSWLQVGVIDYVRFQRMDAAPQEERPSWLQVGSKSAPCRS